MNGGTRNVDHVVLHICDKLGAGGASIHGVGRLLSWWFPVFQEKGYRPRLCVLRPRDNAGDYFEERGIPVRYLGRSKFDVRTATDLVRIIREEKPDVVHLHGYGAWTFGRFAAKLTRVPVVLHEHMVGGHIPLPQKVSDILLAGHDPTCVVSQAVYDFCVNKRFIKPQNAVIIPNGIPFTEFRRPSSGVIDEFRDRLGVYKNAPLIGSVGRLDPRKGYEYLIKAMPRLLERFPDIKVVIAGDGELEGSLKKLSRDIGVQDQVLFLGFWRDVSTLLAALTVVVIPSLSEGFSLSLIEAMAMGKPVVSTAVGGLGEIVEDGKTALIVRVEDPADIADKVSSLLEDVTLSKRIASEAQKLARDRYDIAKSASMITKVYDQVINRHAD